MMTIGGRDVHTSTYEYIRLDMREIDRRTEYSVAHIYFLITNYFLMYFYFAQI